MKDFIKIQDERVRKSTIKKYRPFEESKLNVYFNTSRYKIELQTFSFGDKNARDDVIKRLDLEFGLIE